jgi:hypothetical protein
MYGVTAFIVKDNKVINARHSQIGVTQGLQKLEN